MFFNEKKEMYRDAGLETPESVLEKEIDRAVENSTTADPFCSSCKKLRKEIENS